MAKLTPDATRTECGLVINEKIIPWGAKWPKDSGKYKKGQKFKADKRLSGGTGKVAGVTIHNTNDLENVEEDAEQYTRATWPNANMNDARVHYYVDDINAWQNLEDTEVGWHAGDGSSGKSANDTHISFEICEDGLDDPDYFARAYREAVELTAMLCKQYGQDPLADGVVICHQEGYRRGIASNHGDVLHWFPRFGKSMDDFRADVAAELGRRPEAPAVDGSNDRNDKEEDGMVYYERLGDVADGYKTTIRKLMERGGVAGTQRPGPGQPGG